MFSSSEPAILAASVTPDSFNGVKAPLLLTKSFRAVPFLMLLVGDTASGRNLVGLPGFMDRSINGDRFSLAHDLVPCVERGVAGGVCDDGTSSTLLWRGVRGVFDALLSLSFISVVIL